MDRFIHFYSIIGIAYRMPLARAVEQAALYETAARIIQTIDDDAARAELPPVGFAVPDQISYIREKLGGMRSNFRVWRDHGFPNGTYEQKELIALAVLLANGDEVSGI